MIAYMIIKMFASYLACTIDLKQTSNCSYLLRGCTVINITVVTSVGPSIKVKKLYLSTTKHIKTKHGAVQLCFTKHLTL